MLRYWPGAFDLARRAFSVRILLDFPVALRGPTDIAGLQPPNRPTATFRWTGSASNLTGDVAMKGWSRSAYQARCLWPIDRTASTCVS
jgi:hypothetical protein